MIAGGKALPSMVFLAALHFLALFSAAPAGNHRVFFIFFFFTMVLIPGFILTRIIFPKGMFYYRIFLSILLGFAQMFILLLIFSFFKGDIFYLSVIIPVLGIVFAALGDYGNFKGFEIPNGTPLSKWIIILMLAIAAFVSLITLRGGDPVLLTGDSQDHIAYIKAVTTNRQAFPDEFLYKNGGMLTRDIRRGLAHSMWGAINILTGEREVFPVWPFLSWIGSLSILLGIFCVGVQYFKKPAIGLGGAVLYLLFYQGGLAGHSLITSAYGFYFGKIFLFGFFMFLPKILRSLKKEYLVIALVSSFAATATHISYFLIIYFVIFIFSLVEWFQVKGESGKAVLVRAVPCLAAGVFAVNLPYLLLRYLRDYNPLNEIHTHVQGMLFLGKGLAVLNPILFFRGEGHLMVTAFFAIFILWKVSRKEKNLRLLLGSTAAVYILVFNPLWVPFIMEKITYLIVRFSAASLSMLVTAYLINSLLLKIKDGSAGLSGSRAILGWIIILLVLSPPLYSDVANFSYAGDKRKSIMDRSALKLKDLYSEIDKRVPPGSVIASDPVTSYCIPAFCDQYVVCTYDQHSTPNDSTALDRIIACRNIYMPDISCADIGEILEKYEAGFVVINGRIPSGVISQYWRPDADLALAAADKLKGCGDRFEMIFSHNKAFLFRYLGSRRVPSEEEEIFPSKAGILRVGRFRGDYRDLTESGIEGVYMKGWGKEAQKVNRGDSLSIYVDWVTGEIKGVGSYRVYLRFDTGFGKGPLYSYYYGKIYRKILEKIKGERYRFRHEKIPFAGVYPPDRWEPGMIYRDYYISLIPKDIAPGKYTISVKMHHAPHVPNYDLRDFITDSDIYDGPDIMNILIE